jgi:Ribonuclease G/E
MYSIRLRGIYATALAALLHEHSWRVVQPPPELQAITDVADRFAPFDLEVKDREDRHGVIALGTLDAVNALKELLFAELPDVICIPGPAELGAIYLGIVHKRRAWGYEIDLGDFKGFLPKPDLDRPLKKGEAVRVQVKEIVHPQPIVTTKLSLAGRFAVLSQEQGVGISKEITDTEERERLFRLGRKFCANGWGVIWRTSAYQRDIRDLQGEIQRLRQQLPMLESHPDEGIPGKLLPGQTTMMIEFPGGSKHALDRWRARLVPTEPGYHRHHAHPADHAQPLVGQRLLIEHIKVRSEQSITLIGQITHITPQQITVRREIKGSGLYDGLNIPKEPGDYAMTEFHRDSWHYETRYYARDGTLKGVYVNINTPIEFYGDRVRYVDLEIDVVQRPGEPAQIIDEHEVQSIAHYVSPQLIMRARELAIECAQRLNARAHGRP